MSYLDRAVRGAIATIAAANLRGSLDIAKQEFDGLRGELNALLSRELPALEKDLDAAGVPWTPGRGVGGGE